MLTIHGHACVGVRGIDGPYRTAMKLLLRAGGALRRCAAQSLFIHRGSACAEAVLTATSNARTSLVYMMYAFPAIEK